jgi:hypothetical protein
MTLSRFQSSLMRSEDYLTELSGSVSINLDSSSSLKMKVPEFDPDNMLERTL